MKVTAVIMAGGKGERFWPKSRRGLPKQFLSLTSDGKTMIQLTAERHLPLVDWEDMFVVTNKDYVGLVREQLPKIPSENILAEPMARNTAPAIGFAAAVIKRKYGDAVMLILASDHLIKHESLYTDTMAQAIDVAEKGENLVTMGITPTYPETGYGYINYCQESGKKYHGAYPVNRFVEKPDIDNARKYLESGQYLWNSGMFVWKLSTILNQFQKFLPDTYQGIEKIGMAFGTPDYETVLTGAFEAFKSESVDFGIMERAENIYTIPGNFGWDDVGSWLALGRVNGLDGSGNMAQGDVIAIETKNSIIVGGKKLIAAVGLENIVVVDTDDAILICAKDCAQDVKKVIESLNAGNRQDLL